jgi:hypothetical protein
VSERAYRWSATEETADASRPIEVPGDTEGVRERQSNQSRPAYLLVQKRRMRRRRRPRGPPRPSGTGSGPAGGRDGRPDTDRDAVHMATRGHVPQAQSDEAEQIGEGAVDNHMEAGGEAAGGCSRSIRAPITSRTTTLISKPSRCKERRCHSPVDGQRSKQRTIARPSPAQVHHNPPKQHSCRRALSSRGE